MDTQLPPQKGESPPPIFGPSLLWQNGWMHQDSTLYGGRPQPRRLCVRWEPSHLPKKGRSPQFSVHVYCGQTAAWIKMPLGVEVGLGLRDIVFGVDPATPRKKGRTHPHPIFGPCVLWPNGWMGEYGAWYGSRPRPRPHCTRRVPAATKGVQRSPCFPHMSVVATVAHLSYCWALV